MDPIDLNYEVRLMDKQLDVYDDNVDVFVYFADGRKYVATFFTLKNIGSLMSRYRETGESAGGRYFWAADAIIVDRLDPKTIETAVADLLASGEFGSAFSGPHADE